MGLFAGLYWPRICMIYLIQPLTPNTVSFHTYEDAAW